MSARLAERLHEEADQRLTALTDKHKVEVAALNDTLFALRNEVESFRSQSERQALALTAEKAAHSEAQSLLQEARIIQAQATQRIRDMEAQLAKEEAHRASLEEKHQHAREALEHFRVAAKEQREQALQQFEQQIQFLQGELRATKDTVNARQQELIHSHQDNARLSSELIHARNEMRRLDEEAHALRLTKEQLTVAEAKNQQLSAQLTEMNATVAHLTEVDHTRILQLKAAADTERRLESELGSLKAVIASHEKIFEKLTPLKTEATSADAPKSDADNQNSVG